MRTLILSIFFLHFCLLTLAFAGAAEIKQIQEMEAETQKTGSLIMRPRVEYRGEGLRDPFVSKIKQTEAGGSTAQSAETPPALSIQGIVWGAAFPQAIVNNKVVKIGDTIENARIIDISKAGITILFAGRQYNLSSPAAMEIQKKIKSGD